MLGALPFACKVRCVSELDLIALMASIRLILWVGLAFLTYQMKTYTGIMASVLSCLSAMFLIAATATTGFADGRTIANVLSTPATALLVIAALSVARKLRTGDVDRWTL